MAGYKYGITDNDITKYENYLNQKFGGTSEADIGEWRSKKLAEVQRLRAEQGKELEKWDNPYGINEKDLTGEHYTNYLMKKFGSTDPSVIGDWRANKLSEVKRIQGERAAEAEAKKPPMEETPAPAQPATPETPAPAQPAQPATPEAPAQPAPATPETPAPAAPEAATPVTPPAAVVVPTPSGPTPGVVVAPAGPGPMAPPAPKERKGARKALANLEDSAKKALKESDITLNFQKGRHGLALSNRDFGGRPGGSVNYTYQFGGGRQPAAAPAAAYDTSNLPGKRMSDAELNAYLGYAGGTPRIRMYNMGGMVGPMMRR